MPKSPQKGVKYTYADYITWDDGKRYELIDGHAYEIDHSYDEEAYAAAGSLLRQQEVFGNIMQQLKEQLHEKEYAATSPDLQNGILGVFSRKNDGAYTGDRLGGDRQITSTAMPKLTLDLRHII